MGMDRLPLEIILFIVDEIPELEDRLHLLQICQSWRANFLAVGFRTICIRHPQLQRLVGAGLANSYIKLSIRDVTVEERFDRDPVKPREAIQELIDLISDSPAAREKWYTDLSVPSSEAWIALVLAVFPNLTAFSATYNPSGSWISHIVAKAAWGEPPFDGDTFSALRHLERLDITWRDEFITLRHDQNLPFFHLPSLRYLRVGPAQGFDTQYSVADHSAFLPAEGTSPIETLVLDFHCNGRDGMVGYITSCARLKRFIYQHMNEYDTFGDDSTSYFRDFRPWRFHEALVRQRDSLEVLHLNNLGEASTSHRAAYRYLEEPSDPMAHNRWFGSLAEFHKLRDLRIRLCNLLNLYPKDGHSPVSLKDVLPTSLENLHLADCAEESCDMLVSDIEDLLAQRETLVPNLRSLLISPAPGSEMIPSFVIVEEPFRTRLLPLQEICDRVGVEIHVGEGLKMIPLVNSWQPGRITGKRLSDESVAAPEELAFRDVQPYYIEARKSF
ncbi:hypothetical protein FQN54_001651 [Arachnomyces sp. PD_36]|nr:hypothetical protein FQN54_001651 [Arachnomyces sp. PD_36]